MKKVALTLACSAFSVLSWAQSPVQSPVPTGEISPALVGQVISRTALFQQVAVPNPSCTQTPVTVPAPKSGAGAMMGAIAGAAVGSQIGGGQGQVLATMAGLMGGAILGDNIEKPAPSTTYNSTTCTTQTTYENRLVGYQVVYEFAGKQYSVQLPQDPGPTISLQVAPVSVANAPMAPTVVMNPPAVSPPQVIYAPPTVVYGSPYYYGNPYPFSTSINLGWGYRGGYGRRWH